MDMQVALLRVLEEHSVRPVGSLRDRQVDVRIVCATNKDLAAEVRSGRFREDLYHRLNVIEIRLPPLRERLADIPLLADHLLSKMREPRTLHVDALTVLLRQPWPGNVRQLDNVLRAAALLTDGPEITPEILQRILADRAPRAAGLLGQLKDQWRSAGELAKEIRVSTRTVNRELSRLRACGLVEAFGEARSRRYRLACRDSSRLGTARP
jgi:DNA-binding NtrC family response regulator